MTGAMTQATTGADMSTSNWRDPMQDPENDPDLSTATREWLHEQQQQQQQQQQQHEQRQGAGDVSWPDEPIGEAFILERPATRRARRRDAYRSFLRRFEHDDRNVGDVERWTSVAAGAVLTGLGIARRDRIFTAPVDLPARRQSATARRDHVRRRHDARRDTGAG